MKTQHVPKHLSESDLRKWRTNGPGRVTRTAVAAVMAGLLALPSAAWAATDVTVDGAQYFAAANGAGSNGGTWAWDGADDMALNGYDGGGILANGDLNIELTGDNTVTVDQGYGVATTQNAETHDPTGDVTITGDGSLSIKESEGGNAGGVYANEVTIDGATVDIEQSGGTAINAQDDVTIKNGSYVTIDNWRENGTLKDITFGIKTTNGDITIADSTVDVKAHEGMVAVGQSPNVNITNSIVKVNSRGVAISSNGEMTLANSDIAVSNDLRKGVPAIRADKKLTLREMQGATIREMVDTYEAEGVQAEAVYEHRYFALVGADGSTTTLTATHTGQASKFKNGVGYVEEKKESTKTDEKKASSADSTPVTKVATAKTGGVAGRAAAVIPTTADATSFAPVVAALLGGMAAAAAGIARRRRS